jgi:acyl-CoA reductase-like NAD-dependent aldehyde dehydrogenase
MKQRHFKSMVFEASGSEPTLEIKSPFDGAMVGTVSVSDGEDIERSLATAYRLFKDRRGWLAAADRETILRRTTQILFRSPGRPKALPLRAARSTARCCIKQKRVTCCISVGAIIEAYVKRFAQEHPRYRGAMLHHKVHA